MVGGLGKDHFHVNMTAGSAVTGTKIKDFNATQGDRLVLDGIKDFDASKIAVALNSNGHDYDVSYDGTFVATVNLQYTPEGQSPVDWNPGLEKATDVIKRMVRAGQADAKADYLYGTDAEQTFRYSGRKLNVVDFSTGDKFDLRSLAAEIKQKYGDLSSAVLADNGTGTNRYITLEAGGTEYLNVKLKAGEVTDQNIRAAQSAVFSSLLGS